MTVPTIHLNGTSKDHLLDDIENAYYALDQACEALKQTAPNGRDYYPQGPYALRTATAEHLSRLQRIDDVKTELSNLACAIQERGHQQ